LFVTLLVGCSSIETHEDTEILKSDISFIDSVSIHNHGRTVGLGFFVPFPLPTPISHIAKVITVDGIRTGTSFFQNEIRVRPGKHTVKVEYRNYISHLSGHTKYTDILTIIFTTEAGHTYRIPAEGWNGRYWIWAEDITTGEIVAGEKPPESISEELQKPEPIQYDLDLY